MSVILIILALIPLLYIPGRMITAALRPLPGEPLERLFTILVVGALLNGWLALVLGTFGIFSIWLHALLVALTALLAHWLRRPDAPQQPARWSPAALATLALVVTFGVLVARPFETIIGARDAGTYANAGIAMARTGALVQRDPLLAQIAADKQSADPTLAAAAAQAETNLLGVQNPHRFIATRFRAAGFFVAADDLAVGRVVPQGLHLLPAWIGLLVAIGGAPAGLIASGLLGTLGLWAVAMLGWRLAGPWVGVLAALLLGLNGVQLWFARYTTAESTVQLLVFAGLFFFAGAYPPTPAPPLPPGERGVRSTQTRGVVRANALLAGICFGQWALARLDVFLILAPLALLLGYAWLTRRFGVAYRWLGLGLGAMLLHATLHGVFVARAYIFDTLFTRLQDYALTALLAMPFLTPTLQTYYLTRKNTVVGIRLGPGLGLYNWPRIIAEIAVVAIVIALVLLVRWRGQALLQRAETWIVRHGRALLAASALGIVLISAYGYLVRPRILTPSVLAAIPACLAPAQLAAPTGACLVLQGYIGAPIAVPTDDRAVFTIPLANFVRVGWYLSPLGVVLGVAGLALWWRRITRANWLFLVLALLTTGFFVRQSFGASDQHYIYILRRFLPISYPAFALASAYALMALARGAHWRRAIAGGLGAALTVFLAVTALPIVRHTEYAGATTQIAALAERFRPDDVLLLRSGARDTPDLVMTSLIYQHNLDALAVRSERPDRYAQQLAEYVAQWQAHGRRVFLLAGPSGGVGLPGQQALRRSDWRLQVPEFEQLTNQKPRNVADFTLDLAVYELLPGIPAARTTVPIDAYAGQIRGLYRAETYAGSRLAWTDGDALLRLDWPAASRQGTVQITLAAGKRPAALGPAQVCLSARRERQYLLDAADDPFGAPVCYTLDATPRSYALPIDQIAPADATGTLLIKISSTTWIPAEAGEGSNDRRRLGVLVGEIGVTE